MKVNRFSDLPDGSDVFVDSNIITYHLSNDPVHGDECKSFLKRIEDGKLSGLITPIVVSEVTFNFIKSYVIRNYKPKNLVKFLKKNPDIIEKVDLSTVSELLDIFFILPVGPISSSLSFKIIKKFHLLPNDAINVVIMLIYEIQNIATNDPDFERVKGIKIWKP